MKGKSSVKKIAKKLYKLSISDGKLSEKSVRKIVTTVLRSTTRNKNILLKQYKRYIEMFVKTQELVVEIPKEFILSERVRQELLKKTKATSIKVLENPNLLFGTKVIHGDWVYDNTLSAKLEKIVS